MLAIIKTGMLTGLSFLMLSGIALAQPDSVLTPEKVAVKTDIPVATMQKTEAGQAPVELSLNSIVLFALSDNPDIGIAHAREKQAKAMTGRAKAKFQPIIDGVAEGAMEYNDPAALTLTPRVGHTNPSSRTALSLRQLIYDFGQTSSNYKQFKTLEKSANIQTGLSEQAVLNDSIQYYLQMLNYQKSLTETEKFVERMNGLVKIIADMYEAGGTSKATLDYAKSRLAFAQTQLNNVRSSLNDAVSNLEFLTGKLPTFVAVAPDELDPSRMDLDYYRQMGEQQNLAVLLNASDQEALDYKMKSTKSMYMPNFYFYMNGEEKQNDGGEVGRLRNAEAMVQMNFRFYDGGDRREQVNLVKGQMEELEVTKRKTLNELTRQVKLSYNQIVLLNESIQKTQQEIVSSEALQDLNRENFKLGSINIIELVEGEERLNAARTKIFALQSDLYTSTYQLLLTTGMLRKNFFCDSCV